MLTGFLAGIFFLTIYHEENLVMLEVTDLAQTKLQAYLEDNNISSPVRVALMQGG